jgi:Ser/Thr protein kinase RdoA (MazF antagonist)
VQANIHAFGRHALSRLQRVGASDRRWEVPRLIPARDGRHYWIDPGGDFWRAVTFIEDARSFGAIQDAGHAREVGFALGMFHALVSDLPPGTLAVTLEGFHVTPCYLERYDAIFAGRPVPRRAEVDYCRHAVDQGRAAARVLEEARARGLLPPRVVHGDPKVDNVLLDRASGRAVSLIDLDTVQPGLLHHDVGDCLRSCCNPLGEETERWESARFEPDLCRAFLQGYGAPARVCLGEVERRFLYDAVRLIPFELGLRFFTDYLEGDVYFKVQHPEHNLARALVQFRLAESVEAQGAAIRAMLAEIR